MADTSRKRTWPEMRADKRLSALLASTGIYTQQQINDVINDRATTYGITLSQTRYDIAAGLEAYRQLAPGDNDIAKLLQIARLEFISQLALGAFLESAETDTLSSVMDDNKGTRKSKSKKITAGDAKFLAIATDIEKERNKILGIYAPEVRKEHGDLTVTFTWKDSERPAELPEAQTVDYRLLEDSDGVG